MVLVNHSLFLADLQLDFALLPAYEHIVFDEAHRLPEISNQVFGRSISFFGFRNIAKTLEPSKAGGDGLLVEIASRIPAEQPELHELCDKLSEALGEAEKALHRFFMKIGKKHTRSRSRAVSRTCTGMRLQSLSRSYSRRVQPSIRLRFLVA